MNNKKICFIMCTDNDVCASESITYINRLYVPEGMQVEILTVKEATSMLSGYREGYESTDAGYVVFMHHDVFILNRYFIQDIISILSSDERIGLIGMVGAPKLSSDFIMWNDRRIGNHFIKGDNADYSGYRYSIDKEGYEDVTVVDGFLMVYRRIEGKEVVFRDDILDGWDFYDVSMSIEVLKEGRRVVVPVQDQAWCMHDDQGLQSMLNYDRYRNIALEEYGGFIAS